MTTVPTLIQQYSFIPEGLKSGYLLELLEKYEKQKIIIFVKTCKDCHLIYFTLKKLGHKVSLLHSIMKQTKRMVNLLNFRN
jgi:ATP-dependent RNA helicase DDX49/DBP8